MTAEKADRTSGRNGDATTASSGGVTVDEAIEVTPELVEAFDRLVPQLSSSSPPPGHDQLVEIVTSAASMLLVARDRSGAIIGSLTLAVFRVPTGRLAWIEDVVVDESARGAGAGEALVEAAVAGPELTGPSRSTSPRDPAGRRPIASTCGPGSNPGPPTCTGSSSTAESRAATVGAADRRSASLWAVGSHLRACWSQMSEPEPDPTSDTWPRRSLVRFGGWVLCGIGVIGVVAALAFDTGQATSAASQVWPPFVLVAGLLLVGLVADHDGLFARPATDWPVAPRAASPCLPEPVCWWPG